jgi:uncharacterized protein YecE (DUF72 family)
MDFGKLAHIGRVDFRLPEPSPETVLRNHRAAAQTSGSEGFVIRVGCPVWSQKRWVGQVYPLGAKPPDFLRHYATQLSAIELNVTHYRIPTPSAVREWRDETPPAFRFCPKFPQEISHHRELRDCEPLTAMFCDSLSYLQDRIGTSFLQLPPGFSPAQLPILRSFLKTVPSNFPVCVEFRHPGWFKDHALIAGARDVLEEAQAGTVITDTAGRRDVVHESLTSSRVLMRFVGNELDQTDFSRIDAWIPRLKNWKAQGIREVDWIIHQPEDVHAPELASYFIQAVNESGIARVSDWTRRDAGIQMSLL